MITGLYWHSNEEGRILFEDAMNRYESGKYDSLDEIYSILYSAAIKGDLGARYEYVNITNKSKNPVITHRERSIRFCVDFVRTGCPIDIMSLLDELIDSNNYSDLNYAGKQFFKNKLYPEALLYLDKALNSSNESYIENLELLVECSVRCNDPISAKRYINILNQKKDYSMNSFYVASYYKVNTGDFTFHENLLNKAIDDGYVYVEYYWLGQLYELNGDYDKAVISYYNSAKESKISLGKSNLFDMAIEQDSPVSMYYYGLLIDDKYSAIWFYLASLKGFKKAEDQFNQMLGKDRTADFINSMSEKTLEDKKDYYRLAGWIYPPRPIVIKEEPKKKTNEWNPDKDPRVFPFPAKDME